MIKLKYLREQNHMSQKELGDILNLSQRAISRYENGDAEPDFATVKKISLFFNVTIDYLLGEDDSNIILLTKKDYENLKRIKIKLNEIVEQLNAITNKISSKDLTTEEEKNNENYNDNKIKM